jgi:sucrose-6-phosphate hydrolase SacC (GH32 family)
MRKIISSMRWVPVGACSLCVLTLALVGCGGNGDGGGKKSNVELIVLKEGQTVADVLRPRSSSLSSASSSTGGGGQAPITATPETEGDRLFVRATDTQQNISGFEFCCGQYDTYQEHEFLDATEDFIKLDGGFWGSGVEGTIGERVFSSYGDGYDDETDTSAAQLGAAATGSLRSPVFTVEQNYINFLIGGGGNRFDTANATAVVLIVDDKVVRHAHGKNQDNKVSWDSWDVSEFVGKNAQLQFIDHHPDDGSDASLPYILADEFRAASKAAVAPLASSRVLTSTAVATDPLVIGQPLFTRAADTNQNIAGFEFCCGGYDTYQNHNFIASGDFIRFDGGQWAADIANKQGDRVFASYGQGFANANDGGGKWYGWEATGTLRSPTFTISSPYINFLAGGGTNKFDSAQATAVVLRVNGKIVRQATGNGLEKALGWTTWDVSGLIGSKAEIEIIDAHDNSIEDGSFPFLLLDEFKQADMAAAIPADDSVVSQVDGHGKNLALDMGDPNPFYDNGNYYIYYLQNSGFHPWYLAKTNNLLDMSYPLEVLPASGDVAKQDQWIGSGSVIKDRNNEYHLFYTGHNQQHSPVEAVMHAVAKDNTLTNWETNTELTFSGANGYSNFDFRDPLVFWNDAAQKYWMLITSRYQSKAAIGLYTSTDLNVWAAEAPLYTETSPLNLEVADYFSLGDTPFIIYSDQRDASRQVKYLRENASVWEKPSNDALDGKAFYAARTAGHQDERLLFGWVAHKQGRSDTSLSTWGGDLVVHQLHKTDDGQLAVSLPEKYRTGLSVAQPTDVVWTQGSVDEVGGAVSLAANSAFTLAPSTQKNRLAFNVKSQNANAQLGIELRNPETNERVVVAIDAANDSASYYRDGDITNADNPAVAVPLDIAQGVNIEVLLDPQAGVGAVYFNNYRALSFRLYDLPAYEVGVYSGADAIEVTGLERFAR